MYSWWIETSTAADRGTDGRKRAAKVQWARLNLTSLGVGGESLFPQLSGQLSLRAARLLDVFSDSADTDRHDGRHIFLTRSTAHARRSSLLIFLEREKNIISQRSRGSSKWLIHPGLWSPHEYETLLPSTSWTFEGEIYVCEFPSPVEEMCSRDPKRRRRRRKPKNYKMAEFFQLESETGS